MSFTPEEKHEFQMQAGSECVSVLDVVRDADLYDELAELSDGVRDIGERLRAAGATRAMIAALLVAWLVPVISDDP